ncbi:MAG: DUF3601 domain-containing protein [Anaerolineales bacterium]|nr:DUF3601 domain-containing protein [Anaerolineales bacterium]
MSPAKQRFTAADLIRGQNYIVKTTFEDYDGAIHRIGEQWRFIEKDFLPYDEGLSLFVEMNEQKVQIRLQWRDETQGKIINNFSNYVQET